MKRWGHSDTQQCGLKSPRTMHGEERQPNVGREAGGGGEVHIERWGCAQGNLLRGHLPNLIIKGRLRTGWVKRDSEEEIWHPSWLLSNSTAQDWYILSCLLGLLVLNSSYC